MSEIELRHGIFLPPFHPNEENPTQCLERDLALIVHLDKLGFQEAWIGEHHSAGYEIISRPELGTVLREQPHRLISPHRSTSRPSTVPPSSTDRPARPPGAAPVVRASE